MHVGTQESEESTHSSGLDLTITGGIEMLPSLLEILVEVVIGGFTFKLKMGSKDFLSGLESGDVVEVEVSGWFSTSSWSFHSVLSDHGVHELIITGSWSVEVLWGSSVVRPVTFKSILEWVVWSGVGSEMSELNSGGRGNKSSND